MRNPAASLVLCLLLLGISAATITINHQGYEGVRLDSATIKYTNNEVQFRSFTTILISEALIASDPGRFQSSDPSEVAISVEYGIPTYKWIESWLVYASQTYHPEALIVHGGYFSLGGFQTIRHSQDVSSVVCPVLHISNDSYTILVSALEQTGGMLNITITDEGSNPWRDIRETAWFPIQSVILVALNLAAFGVGIFALHRIGTIRKTIATLCVFLEMAASLIRVLYGIDPYAYWVFPPELVQVFFSASAPISLIVTILSAFFWHELVSRTNLEVTALLAKSKVPAIVFVFFVVTMEVISCAFRVIGNNDTITTINSVVYAVVSLIMIVYFVFVSIKVFLFLRRFQTLKIRHRVLRTFTIRALASAIAHVAFIIALLLAATDLFITPEGESAILFCLHISMSVIGICHLLAFHGSANQKSASKSSAKNQSQSLRLESSQHSQHSSAQV